MKKITKLTLTLLILNTLYLIPLTAQVGINNDNSDPDASAMLDVKSSNKGVLIPRMSSSERQQILSPAEGLMVYDSTAQAFYYFNGMGWLELLSGTITDDQMLSFNTSNNTLSLEDGGSVDLSSIDTDTDDQTLSFNTANNTLSIADGNSVDISSINSVQSIIEDADGDTKIQVEESADEDVIRFDLNDTEVFRLSKNSNGVTLVEFLSSGVSSTLYGQDAGVNLNSGQNNTFIGNSAGLFTTGGNSNTFVGRSAGRDNTTGVANVFLGFAAGASNQIGVRNVFLGTGAGRNNFGSSSVFIGHDAGANETSSNRLYIEASPSSSPLIYGEFDNDLVRINGDLEVTGSFPDTDNQTIDKLNLNGTTLELSLEDDGEVDQTVDLSSIDTDTDNQTLSFDGMNLSIADGNSIDISSIDTDTDDQTLSFDGTNISIADGNSIDISSLGDVQNIIEDADGDTKIQVEEGADEDVIRFDIAGGESLVIRKNSNNATQLFFPDNGSNIFMGRDVGNNNIASGRLNTIIGDLAGSRITSGSKNTVLGYLAFEENSSGIENTIIGTQALQDGNVNGNVAIGYFALRRRLIPAGVVGNFNTAVGHEAGFGFTGSNSVLLGRNAGASKSGDNKLYIDNSDTASPLIYGEFDNDLVRINGNLEVTGSFPGTDNQTLSFDGTNLSLEDGGSVDLSSLAPIGTIQMWPTSTPPSGWLICNGTTFNASTYPELNTVLGGNTLPDFNGRFPLGAGNSGTQGAVNHTLGTDGGQEDVTLSLNQIPAHTHSVTVDYNQRSFSGSNNGASDLQGSGDGENFTSSSAGGGQAHENMPPFYTINFIIKAK